MSPSTESSSVATVTESDSATSVETDVNDPANSDATGRTVGRVRGQRLEITTADLTMYSVITGRAPSREERDRALTWSESDPMNDEIQGIVSSSVPTTAVLPASAMRVWNPLFLSMRVREIWFNGLTIRMSRPHVSNWLRRLSTALQQGRRRVRHVR